MCHCVGREEKVEEKRTNKQTRGTAVYTNQPKKMPLETLHVNMNNDHDDDDGDNDEREKTKKRKMTGLMADVQFKWNSLERR